jgi:hypothetical protein
MVVCLCICRVVDRLSCEAAVDSPHHWGSSVLSSRKLLCRRRRSGDGREPETDQRDSDDRGIDPLPRRSVSPDLLSRVPQPSPVKKLESINSDPGQWFARQVLFALGTVRTVVGITLYAYCVRQESFAGLVWGSVALLTVRATP